MNSPQQRPPVITVTTVTSLDTRHRDAVLVAGSHGGHVATWYAAMAGVRAAIFNDAGIGLDEAGVAGLADLQTIGTAAAAVDAMSARIGDGADSLARGRISRANPLAAALGVVAGMSCREAAERLRDASPPHAPPIAHDEGRFEIANGAPAIWGLDSIGMTEAEDAGRILIIGSHGALHGGDPASALKPDARAAVFHDAGIGIERVGVSRLPVLASRGIAAATVAHHSARIGDARSLWTTGLLSCVNAVALRAGARLGMSAQEFAALFDAPSSARG
jgi:hypothetical protein